VDDLFLVFRWHRANGSLQVRSAWDDFHLRYTYLPGEEPPPVPEEEFYRPIQTDDTLEVEINGINPLQGWGDIITSDLEAPVYATMDGIVAEIDRDAGHVVLYSEKEEGNFTAVYSNMSAIYVSVGDEITAGCVLGLAGEPEWDTKEDYLQRYSQIGFWLYRDVSETVEWEDFADPAGYTMCGGSYKLPHCYNNNPSFSDYGVGWWFYNSLGMSTLYGQLLPDSAILGFHDYLWQQIILDNESDYYLTLVTTAVDPISVGDSVPISIILGDDQIDFALTLTHTQSYIQIGPFDIYEPDVAPDIFNLRLENMDPDFGIEIDFACLHAPEGTGQPGVCYFVNYDFNQPEPGYGWTLAGDAEWVNYFPTGALRIPIDGSASQSVTLYSYETEDVTYDFTITGRNYHAEPVGILSQIDVEFEDYSDSFAFADPVFTRTYSSEITVPAGETWDDLFVLTGSDEGDEGVATTVTMVCIEPQSGIWPGFDDYYMPFHILPYCQACLGPNLEEIINAADFESPIQRWLWIIAQAFAHTTAWLGCHIANLWFCYILDFVKKLVRGIYSIGTGLGYLGRWLAVLFSFLGKVLRLLTTNAINGLLQALAAMLSALWNVFANLSPISLLFDALSVAGHLGSLILALLGDLLGLIGYALQGLGSISRVLLGFQGSLFAAVNSETAVDLGLPACVDPEEPLYGICIAFQLLSEAMDNTALEVLNYIGCAVVAVWIILWTANKFVRLMEAV
jgi:hypothetical protein